MSSAFSVQRSTFSVLFLIIHLSSFIIFSPVAAQPHADAGRRAGTILRQMRPARAAALGGAVAAADRGIQSVWGNPAALLTIDRREVGLTRIQSFADITANMAAFGYRLGDRNVVAVSYANVDYGSIDGRDLSGRAIGQVEAGDHVAGLSWAIAPNQHLDLGATGRVFNEQLGRYAATTFTADLGARIRPPIRNLTLGGAVQNLGGSLKFVSESYSLPRTWRAGAEYMTFRNRLLITAEAVKPADDSWEGVIGLEAEGAEFLVLRAGGIFAKRRSPSFSVGLGVLIRDVTLDYAWIPKHDRIDDQHRVSLQVGF
jgi:hypothetical protein